VGSKPGACTVASGLEAVGVAVALAVVAGLAELTFAITAVRSIAHAVTAAYLTRYVPRGVFFSAVAELFGF